MWRTLKSAQGQYKLPKQQLLGLLSAHVHLPKSPCHLLQQSLSIFEFAAGADVLVRRGLWLCPAGSLESGNLEAILEILGVTSYFILDAARGSREKVFLP